MATKYFTPEFRADANYTLDYNHPVDDSLGDLQKRSARMSGNWNRSALAATFILTMCAGAFSL